MPHILIVEDEAAIADTLIFALQSEGFTTTWLSLAEQALAEQQRNPADLLILDEPTSALDPIATATIEELIDELRASFTICIVTHSMQQAARISQRTAYFHLGYLVELNDTKTVFTNPQHQLTENYITGRFG